MYISILALLSIIQFASFQVTTHDLQSFYICNEWCANVQFSLIKFKFFSLSFIVQVILKNCIIQVFSKAFGICRECHNAVAKHDKIVKAPKTGQNIVKQTQAKRALESAQEELDSQNKLLLLEMPQFHEKRLEYFQPCLQA